ncbi:hypothetical protein M9H77_19713 [Catharanthus roseus]|uniref:Uncharacterized protein n=1 Tax=Catharanthus roseus TaxID=4058 RepID=A0ACC0BB19_CATRO|nr:hypothetical protein M9H77_19713 [Catharanthus roseus]
MALNFSLFSSFNLPTILVLISLILHLLLPTIYSFNHYPPPDTTQGLLVEEKTRLGSTPPSCYNKCNKCHPCTAVQVPTLPNQGRRMEPSPAASLTRSKLPLGYFDSSSPSLGEGDNNNNNRYSNYKPLGWKCRCDGHFYNP